MNGSPSNISAVLFDMDETLVQHARTAIEICGEVYKAFPRQLGHVEEAHFTQTLARKAGDLWQMMFDGVISGDIARPYTFINTLRCLGVDDSLAPSLLETFDRILLESTTLAGDALPVMKTLRNAGLAVGIVTNGYIDMQSRKIKHHALDLHTDFVLISEAVGAHKPHPRIFEEALSRAQAAPDQTLFVGDNLVNDIAGATGAGMRAILIDRDGKRTAKLDSDHSLTRPAHTINELAGVLHLAGLDGVAGAV